MALIVFSPTLAAVPRGIGTTGAGQGPATAPATAFPPLAALYETQVLAEGHQTTAQGQTPLRWYLWRDDQRVETRTIEGAFSKSFDIVRSLPHGHVAAVLGTLRKLELEQLIAPKRSPQRDRVVAMIVARLLDPRSKLASARGFGKESAATSLGERSRSNQRKPKTCTPRWIGCKHGKERSKGDSPSNISTTARSCSTM